MLVDCDVEIDEFREEQALKLEFSDVLDSDSIF